MEMFWTAKPNLVAMFSQFKSKICLTCDIWTSPNAKSILAITCHWLSDDFEQKELLLDAVEMRESHSGEKISEQVLKVLCDYNLQNKNFFELLQITLHLI